MVVDEIPHDSRYRHKQLIFIELNQYAPVKLDCQRIEINWPTTFFSVNIERKSLSSNSFHIWISIWKSSTEKKYCKNQCSFHVNLTTLKYKFLGNFCVLQYLFFESRISFFWFSYQEFCIRIFLFLDFFLDHLCRWEEVTYFHKYLSGG